MSSLGLRVFMDCSDHLLSDGSLALFPSNMLLMKRRKAYTSDPIAAISACNLYGGRAPCTKNCENAGSAMCAVRIAIFAFRPRYRKRKGPDSLPAHIKMKGSLSVPDKALRPRNYINLSYDSSNNNLRAGRISGTNSEPSIPV
ncbi:hypothetical protein EVAR_45912_1 [Eumeta japonica]|uniref:Uncharacterized protein n=1 Tax=Eumeta variegata TaxID=151549 RepID=A0A4C1W7H3_EUMVA|nr:hypothetical protein EVAR_45912_1 [Eumeta japonica]